MRLLLDTHFPIWLAVGSADISPKERRMMEEAAEVIVSAISIWEVRFKWQGTHVSGARKGIVAPEDVLATVDRLGMQLLSLTAAHAAEVLHVPLAHSDPFDELLLAQAQAEGLRLLTRDRAMLGHPLAVTA